MNSLDETALPVDPPEWRGWLVAVVKLVVVALIVFSVAGAVRDAWKQLLDEGLHIDPLFAVPAGLMFLIAQLPMAWYWRQTLLALGQPAPVGRTAIAYYISQIGKYVPGKAMVIILRTERMVREGGHGRTVAASVFIETLTLMAIGAVVSAGLLVVTSAGEVGERGWLIVLATGIAAGCLIPTAPPIARWIIERVAPSLEEADSEIRRGLTVPLMLEGWGASLVTWFGLGMSVWLAAWTVGASDAEGWQMAPLWILTASLPVVAGFLSLLPAGVVVRDGLMLGLLAPVLGEGAALATTIAVRLIWVVSETLLCVILYGVKSR